MVNINVHGTGTLTLAQLVDPGERVFQHLHKGDDSGRLVLVALDRSTGLADVCDGQCHTTAALRQLRRVRLCSVEGFQVVLDPQEVAGGGASCVSPTRVKEGRGCGLEASLDDVIDQSLGVLVVVGVSQSGHHNTVLEALIILLAVEGLQRVPTIELEGTDEGLEAELVCVGPLEQGLEVLEGVEVDDLLVPESVLDQEVGLLLKGVEEHGVLVDVIEEVGSCGLLVLVELDLSVLVVKVQFSV